MEDERDRLLRRGALWAGVPLATALVVPYPLDGGWASAWRMADVLSTRAFVVAPLAGLAMLLAVALPRLPHWVRAAAVAVAGVVALLSLRELVLSPDVLREASHDVRRLSLSAVDGFVGGVLAACALEVAMQRRRGSRLWAGLALVGWLHVLARWLVPLAEGRMDTAPLIGTAEALSEIDRTPAAILAVVPALFYLVLPALQALLALVRLATGPQRRAERRWRSAWAAVLLTVLPGVLVGVVLAVVSLAEQEVELLLVSIPAASLLFGSMLGAVWGVGHFLPAAWDGLRDLGREIRSDHPGRRRRARLAAAVLGVLLLGWVGQRIWRATRPDPRDTALVSLVGVTEDAIVAATMGEPYDPRWNGGYSDLDIRASVGALRDRVGEGAPVEPALFAFELAGHAGVPFSGRVVVVGDRVRWAQLQRGWPGGAFWPLGDTVPALGGAVERASDALSRDRCVEPLSARDLAGLPERARELLPEEGSVERACEELPAEPRRLDDARHDVRGHIGDYLMVVQSGERWWSLRGSWHADGGRLWLGRVEIDQL